MRCCADDLGHPPFGHGGEVALNYCRREAGGFEGNGQTLRLLARLESFSAKAGANLSRRAMLGVLKYPAPRQLCRTPQSGRSCRLGFRFCRPSTCRLRRHRKAISIARLAEQLPRTGLGDHRIGAEKQPPLVDDDVGRFRHAVPRQIADLVRIMIAPDQMLSARQGMINGARFTPLRVGHRSRGEIAQNPQIIVGPDPRPALGQQVRIHRGHVREWAAAKADDPVMAIMRIGGEPVCIVPVSAYDTDLRL